MKFSTAYGMVSLWYGMENIWYGLIWYDKVNVWYGMVWQAMDHNIALFHDRLILISRNYPEV